MSLELSEQEGADWEIEAHVKDVLRKVFKPEFLNRIDETIIFLNLEPDQIGRIVDIQMTHLADRLAEQNIELILSDSARALIARQGYDPVYGARPLKRSMQKNLVDPLANVLLSGKFHAGDRIRALFLARTAVCATPDPTRSVVELDRGVDHIGVLRRDGEPDLAEVALHVLRGIEFLTFARTDEKITIF